jgi:hypothetical protein
MPHIGSKTVERVDIICPFCLTDTQRWKMVPSVWRGPSSPRTRDRTPWPEAVDQNAMIEFEQSVIQAHLPTCKNKNILGKVLIELYGLTK